MTLLGSAGADLTVPQGIDARWTPLPGRQPGAAAPPMFARAGRHARATRTPAALAWLAAGAGVFLQGIAVTLARTQFEAGLMLFWIAQVIPFVVFASLILTESLDRPMRRLVVALIGVVPVVYRFIGDLFMFTGFDELLHQRTLADLMSGSGLFAANPLLSVSPYYPGLESVTGVVQSLTGASDVLTAAVVVLTCRFLLVLVIYQLAHLLLRSHLRASLVVLFYGCSPQFFAFNSQFAYQTMALTLGGGGALLLGRAQSVSGPAARRLLVAASLCFAGMIVTHHLTSWIFVGFLGLWALAAPRERRAVILRGFAVSAGLLAVWTVAIAARLAGYLGPVFLAAVEEMTAFLHGSQQRKLFADTSGVATPGWERVTLVLYAVICTGAALAGGVLLLRNARRSANPALALLGLLNLAFPIIFIGRVAPAAAEVGDRSSTFLFLPLAFTMAGLIGLRVSSRERASSRVWRIPTAVLILLTTLTYLGGLILGSGPDWGRLGGPYIASADYRSADAETRAAVRWAGQHLPVGARITADRFPADMIEGQTRLYPVVNPVGDADPASLYFASQWGQPQTDVVRALAVRYLYVDLRLANDPPHVGNYVHPGEAPDGTRLTLGELTKFDQVPNLRVAYRHGPVTIYDTAGLGVPLRFSGWTGPRSELPVSADLLLGAALAVLLWPLRGRRVWVKDVARDLGPLGSGVVGLALLSFLGLVLFGLRIVPGPALTASGLLAVAVLAVPGLWRRKTAAPAVLRRLVRRTSPLVVAGTVLAAAGSVQAYSSARDLHVVQVERILATVSGTTNGTSR